MPRVRREGESVSEIYEVHYYAVKCGVCFAYENDVWKEGFVSKLEREGWVHTKDGWLCPDCAKKVTK